MGIIFHGSFFFPYFPHIFQMTAARFAPFSCRLSAMLSVKFYSVGEFFPKTIKEESPP